MRGRQGLSRARSLERPGPGSLENPHCRTAAQGRLALARGRGCAQGGLQQPHPAAFRSRQAGHAPTSGTGRALLCSHPGPRWDAPDVVAGPGECPQALSDPRRGAQSRAADAPAHRGRNAEGSRGERLVFIRPAPDQQWRVRGSHHGSRRPQRHASPDHPKERLGPSHGLNKHLVNGLLRPLTGDERQQLTRLSRSLSAPAAQVERARALLAIADGASYTAAAHQVGRRHTETISAWVSRFNRDGLAAVRPGHGGGPRIHYGADAQQRILAEWAHTPQREQDGTATWSLSLLQKALRQAPDGLPRVSTYTIWRTLHEAGLSWQTSRTWCETGVAMRQRKHGVVRVSDPDAAVKRG